VKLRLPAWVSSTHLATAMAFFALVVSIAFLTRQRLTAQPAPTLERLALGRAARLTAVIVYLQIVAGAVMRHVRGGLACGFDFPLCLGTVWPFQEHFGVQAHMVHRVGGFLALGALFWLALRLIRSDDAPRAARVLGALLALGGVAQVVLGVLTVAMTRELWVMTVHSSLGAALLAGAVSTYWLLRPSGSPSGREVESPAGASLGVA
jgi:cytochrome c oxidase assembly protein subunit 15